MDPIGTLKDLFVRTNFLILEFFLGFQMKTFLVLISKMHSKESYFENSVKGMKKLCAAPNLD